MPEPLNTPEMSSTVKALDELRHFLDIPVKISIQLGTRTMRVRDILQLQPNSIIDLPKSAGDNVDILVNGRLIAFGEVLELESCAGIRVTDFNVVV